MASHGGCSEADERVVRDLACRCAELANSDEYEARRRRWRDVNALRLPDRAPVWCRPAGVWKDLVPSDSLQCADARCRSVEHTFRQHLYKDWVGDDHIFPPWWPVHAVWRCTSQHTWGLPTGDLTATTPLGGWRLRPPIQNEDDFDLITVPDFELDWAATEEHAARLADLLGDAMPVKIECGPPLGPSTINTALDQLRGLSTFMLDLALHPERIHRLMSRLLEGTLRALRRAEESGRLTPNNHDPMFCSDPLVDADEPVEEGHGRNELRPCGSRQWRRGAIHRARHREAEGLLESSSRPADDSGFTPLHGLWAAANSQEFQEVSPAMFEEFLLNYQMPVLQQFGATQYGCCEDLTQKIDVVMRIPNLRVFVASAWTDLDRTLEATRGHCAVMWRQRATDVVFPDTIDAVATHLQAGMRRLRGAPYQVVLRELETLAGHPERLREWATVAKRVAEDNAA